MALGAKKKDINANEKKLLRHLSLTFFRVQLNFAFRIRLLVSKHLKQYVNQLVHKCI